MDFQIVETYNSEMLLDGLMDLHVKYGYISEDEKVKEQFGE